MTESRDPQPVEPGVIDAETQRSVRPDDAIATLVAGNERFVAGTAAERDFLHQVTATADGQHPLVVVLGCIDSRVPVEVVFDLDIGDAFVVRTAGNVVDGDVLGSLEFATKVAGAKAIVVLGHTKCGAVIGACDGVELGHLTGLLSKITPAVEAVAGEPKPGSSDPALVQQVAECNVRSAVGTILDRSDVIAELVESGDLAVVGAIYDLDNGMVTWQ